MRVTEDQAFSLVGRYVRLRSRRRRFGIVAGLVIDVAAGRLYLADAKLRRLCVHLAEAKLIENDRRFES